MIKHTWPDGDTVSADCPNCGESVVVQISMVKENNLPVRPAECESCLCDFDVYHDGRIELLRAPPKESNPVARKQFLEKFKKLVFDPSIDY